MRKEELLARLVCLDCGITLSRQASELTCPACGRSHPVRGGVPVVLPERSLIVHELPPRARRGGAGRLKGAAERLLLSLPGLHHAGATGSNLRLLRESLPPDASVLLLGGGVERYGRDIELLGPELLACTVNLDVKPGPVVDLVADGHRVPLPDGCFDLVISQAVLEHVADPVAMLREMDRLLRPGGLIFVDVPFLVPVHMHSDFWRFTPRGLELLLSGYEKVRAGANSGVGSAAALATVQLWAALLSFGSVRLHGILRRLLPPLCWPLSALDGLPWPRRLPALAPASVYFIGRKPRPAEAGAPRRE